MITDVEFIRSSFGGGWLVPTDTESPVHMVGIMGGDPAPIMPLGGVCGWIVEPADAEYFVRRLRDSGFSVSVH